jgi:hypothetical protein
MAGRITKYSEPVPFHKTMGTRKVVLMKRIDDDGVGNTNKGTVSMTDFEKIIRDHEVLVLDFAKRQVEGERTGLEKHDYLAAIEGRAAKLRADGESKEQSFTKTIVDDEIGKLLYKALKRAPGSEVKPAPQPAPPSPEAAARLLGPAHAKMHSMAIDFQRANPRHSRERIHGIVTRAHTVELTPRRRTPACARRLRPSTLARAWRRCMGEFGSPRLRGRRAGMKKRALISGLVTPLSRGENERRCCRSRVFVGGWI